MKQIIHLFARKRNHGFTLVEMVVSVAILAILMAGMMLFISPIVRSFNDTSRNLVAENVSTCVENYLTASIRNATNVVIFGNTNDEKLKENGNVIINKLKDYCKATTDTGGNAYVLKCISLRFDDTDGRYYLYSETINTSGVGDTTDPLNASTRFSVFSKCLYDDLYMDFDFEKPLDMDKATETPQPVRKDTMQMTVKTYADAAHTDPIFVGTGLTELRQIKKDLVKNGEKSTYEFTLYDGISATACDSVKSSNGTDGARNIYIYYVVRNLETSTS